MALLAVQYPGREDRIRESCVTRLDELAGQEYRSDAPVFTGTPAQLADLLRQLRSWRTQRPGLGDQCLTRVLERYSLAGLATSMESLFGRQLVA